MTFCDALATYMAQIVRFETFVSEDLAFPLASWPAVTPSPRTERANMVQAEPDGKTVKPKATKGLYPSVGCL
jgi:hypothetical protein